MHHHGPLAGLGAGTAAVLAVAVIILVAAHRQFVEVVTVIAWTLTGIVIGAAAGAAFYVVLWLRHRVRHPELLAPRPGPEQALPAAQPAAEIPAVRPAAIDPPRLTVIRPHDVEVHRGRTRH